MLRPRPILLCVAALVVASALTAFTARADDDDMRFRRTTPRGSLVVEDGALVIGVPGGRAWGVESELRRLPPEGARVVVRLDVTDPSVREAFVRIAYYASASGRSRQLATADSAPVPAGSRASVAVSIEPPFGAIAYRVRVLARLFDAAARSGDDAITALIRLESGPARPFGSLASRLLD